MTKGLAQSFHQGTRTPTRHKPLREGLGRVTREDAKVFQPCTSRERRDETPRTRREEPSFTCREEPSFTRREKPHGEPSAKACLGSVTCAVAPRLVALARLKVAPNLPRFTRKCQSGYGRSGRRCVVGGKHGPLFSKKTAYAKRAPSACSAKRGNSTLRQTPLDVV